MAAAFSFRPALGMVRVVGSDRSGAVVLVARKLGAPTRSEELGTGIAGDGAVRAGGVGSGDWARPFGSIRGSGAPSAPALHGFVLHGSGGGGRRIAGSIRVATPCLALACFVRAAWFGNVFCATASVSCERPHRMAWGAAAQPVGPGIRLDSRQHSGGCSV